MLKAILNKWKLCQGSLSGPFVKMFAAKEMAIFGAGVFFLHPFCIAIDKQAHDYMAHMYGEVNYIFLNDVQQLPARMPAIYRGLTS